LDPDAQRTISQADLSHTSDFTPYEGMPVTGAIRAVLVRGRPPGDAPGRFLERRLG
jgi:dihydroorotase-like cyclic amidohydrolase